MSKVVCDICGTTYPETAECCPICGCSKDMSIDFSDEDLLMEDIMVTEVASRSKNSRSSRKRDIFDFDEVNPEEDDLTDEDDEEYDEGEDEEEGSGSNTLLVIFLVVLIMALLAAAGFVFVRYFLPNMLSDSEETTAVVETMEQTTETTIPTIPCEKLTLLSGDAELDQEGRYFLLNLVVYPEDTTDEVIFTSADESIATVTSDGRITAVAEGETVVYITCGSQQISCPVVCRFVEETEATTEATEETAAETEETTEATEATLANVELKLKKTDVMLKVPYSFQLELDCDLKPEDVQWSVEHSNICSVDETGYVTALQSGATSIYVKYGNQTAECIVRCY